MRRPIVLICMALSVSIYLLINLGVIKDKSDVIPSLGNELSGSILSAEKKGEGYYRFVVLLDEGLKVLVSVSGEPFYSDGSAGRGSFYVGSSESGEPFKGAAPKSWQNYGALVGRRVLIQGEAELADPARNPRCFDYRKYLRSKGIAGVAKVKAENFEAGEVCSLWRNAVWRIRVSFSSFALKKLGEEKGGLLIGMVLGDRNALDDDIYESFQKNGTAHILAVSGLHIGLLYAAVRKLVGRKRSLGGSIAGLAILFFYAAVSAFSASVVRAVFMIALHILSELRYLRYDMLCTACFCFMAMLIKNPFCLWDAGFRLSYAAIFSLAVLAPYLSKIGENALKKRHLTKGSLASAAGKAAVKSLIPSFALQLGTVPLTMYGFNYISLTALIANIPILFLSASAVPLGIALIPLSLAYDAGFVPEALAGYICTVEGLFCELMIRVNELFYLDGHSYINCVSPPVLLIFVYYALIFFICSEFRVVLSARKLKKRLALFLALLTAIGALLSLPLTDDCERASFTFVDVGQGDCLHIRSPGGRDMLIDSGGSRDYAVGKKTLLPYLLKNGVSELDAAFISHRHTDHYKGLCELSAEMKIKRLYLYEANALIEDEIRRELSDFKGKIIYLKAGDSVKVEDDLYIEVLSPLPKSTDEYSEILDDDDRENEISLVLKVTLKGVSLLMTGDADAEGELSALENAERLGIATKADILKISHHGSKYSSDEGFLSSVAPKAAVVQVGKNNVYGHPSPEAMERIGAVTAKIYRNDLDGAVLVYLEKGGFRIRKMI